MEISNGIDVFIPYNSITVAAISEEMAEYATSVLKDDSAKRLFYIERMIVDICKHKNFNHFTELKEHDIVVIEGILYQVIKIEFEKAELESLTPNPIKRSLSKNAFVQIIK